VQVIAWKDSSLKWPIGVVWDVKLYSLTLILWVLYSWPIFLAWCRSGQVHWLCKWLPGKTLLRNDLLESLRRNVSGLWVLNGLELGLHSVVTTTTFAFQSYTTVRLGSNMEKVDRSQWSASWSAAGQMLRCLAWQCCTCTGWKGIGIGLSGNGCGKTMSCEVGQIVGLLNADANLPFSLGRYVCSHFVWPNWW